MIDSIRLRVLHTACMTVTEIADKLKSTPNAVEEALKNMGYTPIYSKLGVEPNEFVKEKSEMAKGKKTPPEKIAEIRDLRAQGQTLREISWNTGIPYKTVQGYCLKTPAPSVQKEKEPEISEDKTGKNTQKSYCIAPTSISDNLDFVKRDFSAARTILAEYIKSTREQLDRVTDDYAALGGDPNDIS